MEFYQAALKKTAGKKEKVVKKAKKEKE